MSAVMHLGNLELRVMRFERRSSSRHRTDAIVAVVDVSLQREWCGRWSSGDGCSVGALITGTCESDQIAADETEDVLKEAAAAAPHRKWQVESFNRSSTGQK